MHVLIMVNLLERFCPVLNERIELGQQTSIVSLQECVCVFECVF